MKEKVILRKSGKGRSMNAGKDGCVHVPGGEEANMKHQEGWEHTLATQLYHLLCSSSQEQTGINDRTSLPGLSTICHLKSSPVTPDYKKTLDRGGSRF